MFRRLQQFYICHILATFYHMVQ